MKFYSYINTENDNTKSIVEGIYLTGSVEDYFNYDLVCADIIDSDKVLSIPEGVYECEVDGYENTCIAFVWKSPINFAYRGLICDKDDDISLVDAVIKYVGKRDIL